MLAHLTSIPDSMAAPVDRADEADEEAEAEENGFDTVRCATCEMSEVIEGSAEVREHSLARCAGDWRKEHHKRIYSHSNRWT